MVIEFHVFSDKDVKSGGTWFTGIVRDRMFYCYYTMPVPRSKTLKTK